MIQIKCFLLLQNCFPDLTGNLYIPIDLFSLFLLHRIFKGPTTHLFIITTILSKKCQISFYSVAANVANTRNILLKPIEGSSTELERLTEQGSGNPMNKSELEIPRSISGGQSNLQIKGLSSNGLDGDLVLHKEDSSCPKNNVDPLTKSSTVVTHLSSVEEEEGDNGSSHDITNDDGKHYPIIRSIGKGMI